jgi:hypothetical protein
VRREARSSVFDKMLYISKGEQDPAGSTNTGKLDRPGSYELRGEASSLTSSSWRYEMNLRNFSMQYLLLHKQACLLD